MKLSQVSPSDSCNPPSTEEEEGNGGKWEEENGSGGGCDETESRQRVGAAGESEAELFTESKAVGVEGDWQAVEGETEKGAGDAEKSVEAFDRNISDHDNLGASDTVVPTEAEEGRPSGDVVVVPEVSLLDARSDIDLGQRWCPVPQPVISVMRSTSTFSSEGGGGGGVERFSPCTHAAQEVSEAADNGLSLIRGSGLGCSKGGGMKSPVGNQEKVEDKGRASAGEICEAPSLVPEGSEEHAPEQSSDFSADLDTSNPPVAMDEVRAAPGAVSEGAHDVPLSKEISEKRSEERHVDSSVSPTGKEQAQAKAETTPDDGVCLAMIRAIMKMVLPPLDDAAVAMPITPSTHSGTVMGHEAVAETRQRDLNREDTMVAGTIEFTRPPPLRPPTAPLRPRFGASRLRNDASPEGLSGGDDASVIGIETPSFPARTSGSSVDVISGLGHNRRSSTGSSLRNTTAQSAFRSISRSTCRNDKATAASTCPGVSSDDSRGEASESYCLFSPVKLFLSWRRKIDSKRNGGVKRNSNSSTSVGRFTDGGIGRFRSGIERELLEVPPAPPSPAGFPSAGHFLPEESDSDSDLDLDSGANEDDAGADVGDTPEGGRAMMDAETLVAGVVEMLRSQVCDSLAT